MPFGDCGTTGAASQHDRGSSVLSEPFCGRVFRLNGSVTVSEW